MGKGLRITGLCLGIVGIVFAFIGFAVPICSVLGLPVSITGLILSCVGIKKQKDGLGTAALVLSIIAVVFTAITFFTCGLCVLCAAGATKAVKDSIK